MKLIIADATPLILLAKLSLLDVLCEQFRLIVPPAVALEATERQELADARYIQKLIDEGCLKIEKADHKKSSALEKEWGIGKGEAAVLVLAAVEHGVVMTDDFAAIRVAKALRLPFITTPRMLVEFQKQNLLSLDLARAKLIEFKKHAWISPAIIAKMTDILEGGR